MIVLCPRKHWAVFLAFALAAGSFGPATAKVVGEDERASLAADLEAPFSGVGRIVCRDPATGERYASTATLVGDRATVLTTGHFRQVQTPSYTAVIPIDFCAFELRSAAGARVFGSFVGPSPVARFTARAEPNPLTPDWAILKLHTPAPPAVSPLMVRPMGAKELARRSDAFMVSYHSFPEANSRTKRYSPRCKPLPVPGAPLVFSHTCDTESGSSGGLLYIKTASGPRAVGMNHGSSAERNYGQIISREMLRNLPKQAVDAPQ